MKHLIIIGAGNFGRELYWHIQLSIGYMKDYDIKGFIDDVYDANNDKYMRVPAPWLGGIKEYEIEREDVFICAIGDCKGREAVTKIIEEKGGEFINVIHNTSIIQGQVKLGRGVFLGPYTVVCDSASIGNHVMLNTHSAIGHDAVIDDYTCIMSYCDITGWSHIGNRVYMASGVRITPESIIEDDAYIGIGSVVLHKVKEGKKVFGYPAKEIIAPKTR